MSQFEIFKTFNKKINLPEQPVKLTRKLVSETTAPHYGILMLSLVCQYYFALIEGFRCCGTPQLERASITASSSSSSFLIKKS